MSTPGDRRAPLKRTTEAANNHAIATLRERYAAMLHGIGLRQRLSSHDVDDALQEFWLAILKSEDRPQNLEAHDAWVRKTFENKCNDIFRERKRSTGLEKGAQSLAQVQPDSLAPSRDEEKTAAQPSSTIRPLFILPGFMRPRCQASIPGAVIRTWDEVNTRVTPPTRPPLWDLLQYDPIVLGPCGVHPAFPVASRSLERAAQRGHTFIVLLPELAHHLHVDTKALFRPFTPFESHQVWCGDTIESDIDLVGDEWEPVLDAWLASVGDANLPTELTFDVVPGWSMQPLKHYEESDRAIIPLAQGPPAQPARVLVLPMSKAVDRWDPALVLQFIDLLRTQPTLVPLAACLAGSSGFSKNTFDPGHGHPWTLEPQQCAVLWSYLQLAKPIGNRVGEAALRRQMKRIEFADGRDAVRRLIQDVNRSFRRYCEAEAHVPYDILLHEESTVRLRFPNQFSEITESEFSPSPRPRRNRKTEAAPGPDDATKA